MSRFPLLIVCVLCLTPAVFAQPGPDDKPEPSKDEQITALKDELRQLKAEITMVRTENASLRAEVETLKKKPEQNADANDAAKPDSDGSAEPPPPDKQNNPKAKSGSGAGPFGGAQKTPPQNDTDVPFAQPTMLFSNMPGDAKPNPNIEGGWDQFGASKRDQWLKQLIGKKVIFSTNAEPTDIEISDKPPDPSKPWRAVFHFTGEFDAQLFGYASTITIATYKEARTKKTAGNTRDDKFVAWGDELFAKKLSQVQRNLQTIPVKLTLTIINITMSADGGGDNSPGLKQKDKEHSKELKEVKKLKLTVFVHCRGDNVIADIK